jgi:type II secretory pathway pseudopilin PulG
MTNRSKKIHFSTLIELLIGMGLLSILVTVLMTGYATLNELNRKTAKARELGFAERYAQLRLTSVFTRLILPTNKNPQGHFFTQEENGPNTPAVGMSLVFSFENEAVIDPQFSGGVLSKLYLDKNGDVTLAIWPMPKKTVDDETRWPPPMIQEVLCKDILQMGFRFYFPPTANLAIGEAESVKTGKGPEDNFGNEWLKEWKGLPAGVIVILNNRNGVQHEIAVPIPKGQKMINYPY